MNIGKLGAFQNLDSLPATETASFAQEVEKWGYNALWYPEAFGRDSLVQGGWLLASTKTLVIASGIANIYARDPQAAHSSWLALNELSNGRFILGLGVSHAPLVEQMRGHSYSKPLEYMRSYLEKMEASKYSAPAPAQPGKLLLAALGPKMLALSGEKADGAHPYAVTPEHTERARKILGPGKLLCVAMNVLLETDADKARAIGRATLDFYKTLPNYRNNWLSIGFTEEEIGGLADRFIDAMVAWGDEASIRKRIDEHHQAGADHVCIQALGDYRKTLELFAPSR
jgi:probable F420-dependent oxidoreductase